MPVYNCEFPKVVPARPMYTFAVAPGGGSCCEPAAGPLSGHESLGAVRLRLVGIGVIAALALAGLSACSTNAGAAAFVDGHRIAEGDVSRYIVPGFTAPTPSASEQQFAPPRVLVLDSLIQNRLMARLLDKSLGGTPSEADLTGLHDKALATVFGVQQTGAEADAALTQVLGERGVKASFLPVLLRQAELTMAVIDKTHATQPSDIAAAVNKAGIPVSVNARYGSWSKQDAALSGTASLPFLTIGSSAPASPSPQP